MVSIIRLTVLVALLLAIWFNPTQEILKLIITLLVLFSEYNAFMIKGLIMSQMGQTQSITLTLPTRQEIEEIEKALKSTKKVKK